MSFWYIPHCPTVDLDSQKKEKNNTSQMRLRSVFKMRMSILNTATTEQVGYDIISFFCVLAPEGMNAKQSLGEMEKRTEVYECLIGIFTCSHITFAIEKYRGIYVRISYF